MNGFHDCFSTQAAISCYMCGFVSVFDAMCMSLLNVLANRPPLVAICVCVCVCVCFLGCFDAMCMGFFIVLADRQPLIAI